MTLSITLIIVIITVLVSIQCFNRADLLEKLKHWPYREVRTGEWYRFITSGFVHGGWIHLGVNMFVLYEFGRYIESTFLELFGETKGRIAYLALYFLTIIFADLPTFFKHKDNINYASIGASGAVSGIVFIYILLNPWSMLMFYGIIPIPAILGGIAFLAYSSWASKNSRDHIDHLAHFYGAVFGVLFTIALQPKLVNHFLIKLSDLPF